MSRRPAASPAAPRIVACSSPEGSRASMPKSAQPEDKLEWTEETHEMADPVRRLDGKGVFPGSPARTTGGL